MKPPQSAITAEPSTRTQVVLVLALCFIGMNLRPALISLGPVVDSVRASLQLSGSTIGLLITLPVLCFGLFAPFVPRLLRYMSAERLIFFAMLMQAVGIGLRSLFGTSGLFLGTLIAGASISVVMVVLPAIIKRCFSQHASTLMGLYSTALCLGAAIPAALTVPIETLPGSNWRWALGFWLLPVVLSAVFWLPYAQRSAPVQQRTDQKPARLRSNRLAWQITLFMGLQSAIAYCVMGWLPVILIDRGMSALNAGFMLSIALSIQLTTSLTAPWIATRTKDQRPAIAVFSIMTLIGLEALVYAPLSWAWLASSIMGLGMGAIFSIALALLVLRSPNAHIAASLSGMAQGVGYTIAAAGPFMVGVLHEWTGDWHSVAIFFFLVLAGSFTAGMGAGRDRLITLK